MNRWKKLVVSCLAASLLNSFPVHAEMLFPPAPDAGATQTEGTADTMAPGAGPENVTLPSDDSQSGPGVYGAKETGVIAKPEIQAEGAVLMDAATGRLLYEKNPDITYYPASVTKLMTALLVIENSNLDDTVTFSAAATTNLEAGAVSLNITEGDKLTVRQSLYALLLKSANEVANGLAEHVSGSVENFAKLMNEKAKALGCTNTNFTNPHGLNSSSHYTTPRDMALIAGAAFENAVLREIDTTLSYQIPATKKAKARTVAMGHKMMFPEDARYYPGIIGGKTGYTSLAGNTLVTGVERDGVRLIAVIMKSKSTQYADTKALFDYGFEVMKGAGSDKTGEGGADSAGGPGSADSPDTADSADSAGSAGASVTEGWVEDSAGWYYLKPDGSRAANEWQMIDQKEYWFDSNAYMATGWRQFVNGNWYYFKSGGAMAKNYWAENRGKWFYLGADGVMQRNLVTPDGYLLDESGACVR